MQTCLPRLPPFWHTHSVGTLTQLADLHCEGIGAAEFNHLEELHALSALKQLTRLSYAQHYSDKEAKGGYGHLSLGFVDNEVGKGGGRVRGVRVEDKSNP